MRRSAAPRAGVEAITARPPLRITAAAKRVGTRIRDMVSPLLMCAAARGWVSTRREGKRMASRAPVDRRAPASGFRCKSGAAETAARTAAEKSLRVLKAGPESVKRSCRSVKNSLRSGIRNELLRGRTTLFGQLHLQVRERDAAAQVVVDPFQDDGLLQPLGSGLANLLLD